MRLDKLEVRGFKSFRDKTVIEFPDKFTSIVGPNGSGKSNLTEAVCFVLGKSRGLRANVIQDLIFNGAKDGTPAKKTVVAITLSDDDGKTYRISRMVDIDGRSLYKLNDQRVTRDKIIDIVGDNEYNIILQDDVTKVIEMKPSERRVVIDDLCGIGEYDKKKAKAVKELSKVEDKISETHIVLGEKQGYLVRLRKERDDALKYKGVEGELERNRASLINLDVVRLGKKVARLDEKLSELNGEKEAYNLKISGFKGGIEVERVNLKDISQRILNLEEGRSRTRITELSSEIRGVRERIGFLGERESSLNTDLNEYSISRKRISAEIRNVDEELPKISAELSRLAKKIAVEAERVSGLEVEGEIEQAQTQVLDLKSREKSLGEKIIELKESASLKDIEEKQFRSEIELAQSERVDVTSQINDFEESYRVRERSFEKIRSDLTKSKGEFGKIEQDLEEVKLSAARAKTRLKTIEEAGGGVKGAVKAVMRLRDVLAGIHGTVSHLGSVSDEKFEAALQVAAGGRLQNIVVEDVDVAGKCIDYLKKKKVGRATFLPLNKLNVNVSDKVPSQALGLATDFIKTEKQFKIVFDHVFGDTLLVKDLTTAKKIGVGKHRMVTVDGELFERSGALTGGYVSKTGEIGFSNIEELEKEIASFEEADSKLSRKKEALQADIVQYEAKLYDYQKLVDEKTEVERLRIEQKRVDDRITDWKDRLKKVLSARKDDLDKIVYLEKEISTLHTERKVSEKALSKLSDERKKYDTGVIDELKKKETDQKVRESGISEKNRSARQQLSELDVQITKISEEKERVLEEKKFKQSELSKIEGEFTLVEQESASLGAEIKNLLGLRDKSESKITELSANVNSIEFELSGVYEKIQFNLVEKAKSETELEAIKEDFNKYGGVELIDAPASHLDRAIMTFERQLEEFGSINMKAIEAFDQVQLEYDGIESRLNTLKAERQSIFDFMEEVERKKYEVFMGTFKVVKANFEEIFNKLSEGEGTLILDNPKDISQSGLLIKASPAGKKIMNLEAMSGGEKVLTSAAFLLAIQQYKPSSFYIVDELDAALDKTNSVRLAEMLKQSSAQFLLVTHNNSVIKYADSVVGVSMQNGVSNIVEVRLEV
ncbi:MAG: chromosome segregation protein SMC [Methanobacteriota archaeon]